MLKTTLDQEADKLLACVHCGLCLPTCPTYHELGNENDSPRGRLYLMRAVAEEKIDISPTYHKHLDLCLGCRACETVCPSGVNFGNLLESARAEMVETQPEKLDWWTRVKNFFVGLVLKQVFTRKWLLNLVWTTLKTFQRSGLVSLLLKSGLFKYLPVLEFALALLNKAESQLPLAKQLLGNNSGEISDNTFELTYQVAQFTGCIMEGLFTETNRATTRVLSTNGCLVEIPSTQACCGALHAHSGFHKTAVMLAKLNIDTFMPIGSKKDFPIIVNAAGCGAMMKDYGRLLANDPDYSQRAKAFSARVKDVSEFLATIDLRKARPLNTKITYDAPCHLYHGQAVRQQPIDLLKKIPGAEFVPLVGAEMCCGSAGIYNLTHPTMARKLLTEKIENIKQTKAEVLVTGNPGCAMHIGAGLQLAGEKTLLLHPVELLDLAYQLA
ncbi:MAG: hypothetical protein FD167_2156, partial [bacterium]